MRCFSRTLVLLGCLGVLTLTAFAVAPDVSPSRFQQIPDRNIFGLKEPPVQPTNSVPPQTPKLMLTGITTILGNKRALLKELPVGTAGKPADPNKDLSHILTEGQREGDVEVLQIDERAGRVKVNVAGNIETLTFEKDGPKLPSTPAPAAPGVGAVPGTPGVGAVASGTPTPPATPAGIVDSNNATLALPTRTPRWPMTGSANAAATPALPQIPSPTGRATTALPTASAVPNTTGAPALDMQGLTPEEQRIVQQLQHASQPTPLTPSSPTGSGTFQTPVQEGIAPALTVPLPPLPQNISPNQRPVLPQ